MHLLVRSLFSSAVVIAWILTRTCPSPRKAALFSAPFPIILGEMISGKEVAIRRPRMNAIGRHGDIVQRHALPLASAMYNYDAASAVGKHLTATDTWPARNTGGRSLKAVKQSARTARRPANAECQRSGKLAIARFIPPSAKVLMTLSGKDGLGVAGANFSACAVVGNAGHLRTTRYGRAIDSHTAVFRFNNAPTKGYEEMVGAKATVRLLNKMAARRYASNKAAWLPLEPGALLVSRGDREIRVGRGRYIPALLDKSLRSGLTKRVGSRVLSLREGVSKASYSMLLAYARCHNVSTKATEESHKPSSGLMTILAALSLCTQVDVYGMGGGRAPKGYPYHYFELHHIERETGVPGHEFALEERLFRHLDAEGVLRMCPPKESKRACRPSYKDDPCTGYDATLCAVPATRATPAGQSAPARAPSTPARTVASNTAESPVASRAAVSTTAAASAPAAPASDTGPAPPRAASLSLLVPRVLQRVRAVRIAPIPGQKPPARPGPGPGPGIKADRAMGVPRPP